MKTVVLHEVTSCSTSVTTKKSILFGCYFLLRFVDLVILLLVVLLLPNRGFPSISSIFMQMRLIDLRRWRPFHEMTTPFTVWAPRIRYCLFSDIDRESGSDNAFWSWIIWRRLTDGRIYQTDVFCQTMFEEEILVIERCEKIIGKGWGQESWNGQYTR